jgi:hypothetical protein
VKANEREEGMSEAPEKIRTNAAGNAIVTPQPVWDTDVEYIRADVAQAMAAKAQEETRAKTLATISLMLGDSAILALATTEEEALLEKMLGKVREEALRDAAEMVNRNLGKPAHHAHAAIIALIHTGEDT